MKRIQLHRLHTITFLLLLLTCKLNAQNTWLARANVGPTTRAAAASFVIGNKGYIGLGNNYPATNTLYNDLWEYDASLNTWTQKASAPAAIGYSAAFALGGRGYVCGGMLISNTLAVYEYNPVSNTWATKANLPGIARRQHVAFTIGNRAYMGMGRDDSNGHLNDFYEYNPATDTWTARANYPVAVSGAMAFVIGSSGRAYVAGGNNSSGSQSVCYEYNPDANTWTSRASLPSVRYWGGAYTVGNKGYITTGFVSSSFTNTHLEYDPVANTWTTRAVYPFSNGGLGSGFGMGIFGYYGNGYSTSTNSSNNVFYRYTPTSAIGVEPLSAITYCPGQTLNVSYSSIGITFISNTFAVQLSDANGQWGSPVTIGTLVSNLASGTISCTLPGTASGTGYRIRIVSNSPLIIGGDNGTSLQIQRPVVSATNNVTCSGTPFTTNLSSDMPNTTYTWTVSQPAGISGGTACASSCGSAISQTLTNTTTSAASATYTVTPVANGCTGAAFNTTVQVNPRPTMTPSGQTVCSQVPTSVALSSPVSGTTYTWTAALLSGTASGFSNCSSSCGSTIAQSITNTTTANATVRYTITPSANGCAGTSATADVVVNPQPTGSASPVTSTICAGSNTATTLSSNISGSTYTWTVSATSGVNGGTNCAVSCGTAINQILTSLIAFQGNVTYTITPRSPLGCNGSTFTSTYLVNPSPNVLSSNQTICSGTSTSLALSSNVSGTLYTWTASVVSGSASGFSNQVTPVAGPIVQTLTNNTAGNTVVRYSVRGVVNGCTGPTYDFDVTLLPAPGITTTPVNYSICSGNATSVFLASNIAGSTFSWTLGSSTITGGTACSTSCGVSIAQTLTNPSNSTAANLVYNVRATSPSGCTGNVQAITVEVKPRPVGSATNQTICSGQTSNVVLNSSVTGTTYTWTAASFFGSPAGFSNQTTPVTGPIQQNVTTLTNAPSTARYTVSPTANACSGNAFTVDITANPVPVGTATPNPQTICSGAPAAVNLSSNLIGTLYSWTVSQASGISGAVNCPSACGNAINQVLTNSNPSGAAATYQVTPSVNGCAGNPLTVTVNVNPVASGTNQTGNACNGVATNLPLSATPSGSLFTWTASLLSGTASGFSNQTTPVTGPITQTLVNNSGALAVVRYVVTPVFNNCPGTPFNYDVTVNPTITGSANPSSGLICSGNSQPVSLGASLPGATFTWTVNTTGSISGATNCSSSCGTSINQVLSLSGINNQTATYTITPLINGCAGTNFSTSITVKPFPAITATIPNGCSGAPAGIQLNTTIPGFTSYTWTASLLSGSATGFSNQSSPTFSNVINQVITNTGTTPAVIRYVVTPSVNSCPGAPINVDFTVNPTPVATATGSATFVCSGTPYTVNMGSNVPGSTFTYFVSNIVGGISGNSNCSGSCGTSFTQTLVNHSQSNGQITYTITPNFNGCFGASANVTLEVRPVPSSTSNSQSICQGVSTNLNLQSSIPSTTFTGTAQQLSGAAITGFNNISSPQSLPFSVNLGNATDSAGTVRYLLTPSLNGCSGSTITYDVKVRPSVVNLTIGGPTAICGGDSVTLSSNTPLVPVANLADQSASPLNFPVQCDCPPGHVAVGISGRRGAWFDRFALICRPLNSDGTLGLSQVTTSFNGTSNGGAAFGPNTFPGSAIMVGADVNGINGNIHNITFYGQLLSAIVAGGNPLTSASQFNVSASGSSNQNLGIQVAPPEHVIVGMIADNGLYSTSVTWKYAPVSNFVRSYAWSNGATAASINVNQTGNYSLTYTEANSCPRVSASVPVNVTPQPPITTTDTLKVCVGGTKNLTTTTGSSYLWSNGATTQNIAASPGTYSVTVDGCTSQPYTLLPRSSFGLITSSAGDDICPGASTVLNAHVADWDTIYVGINGGIIGVSNSCANGVVWAGINQSPGFTWTDNSNKPALQVIIDFAIGYNCSLGAKQPNFNNQNLPSFGLPPHCTCWSVAFPDLYSINIPASAYNSNGTNTLTFTNATEFGFRPDAGLFGNYARVIVARGEPIQSTLWSTGSTQPTISVNTIGNYIATVTDYSGCSFTDTITIGNRTPPVPVITRSFSGGICNSGVLNASPATSYLWSTGSTLSSISISAPGTYTVTVTDAFGCTGTATDSVPSAIIGDTSSFGNGVWNVYSFNGGGSNFSVSDWVNYRGFYVDTTLNFNTQNYWGVNSSPSAAPGYQGCAITDDWHSYRAKRRGFDCGYYSIDITAHDDAAQLWIDGVMVWSHNGCCDSHTGVWTGLLDSLSTVELRVTEGVGASVGSLILNPVPFQLVYSGPLSFCAPNTVSFSLSASEFNPTVTSLMWSDGSTDTTLLVSSNASVYATLTGSSGCFLTTDTAQVLVSPQPVITGSASSAFCQGNSNTLTASTGNVYAWSNGSTSQSITVSSSGSYVVTVDGCTSQPYIQTVYPIYPGYISSSTGDSVCASSTTLLTAEIGSIDTITITSSNLINQFLFCGANSFLIQVAPFGMQWFDPNPLPVRSARLQFCKALENSAGGSPYLTTLNGNTGPSFARTQQNNSCILVPFNSFREVSFNPAHYNLNGNNVWMVTSLHDFNAFNSDHPLLTPYFGRLVVSHNDSVQSVLWSNGSTSRSIVAGPGVYTATITDLNGCTRIVTKTIIAKPEPTPSITTSFTSFCGSGTLTASPAVSYQWNTGSTSPGISINAVGVYTVTVTDSSGCSASASVNVTSAVPGNPAVFGQNAWIVYGFNSGNGNLFSPAWSSNYAGYYVDSSLSFITNNRWPSNQSPSAASGYQGCPVQNDNHSFTAKRRGFPCGLYTFSVNNHDDAAELLINGVSVWSHNGCCDSHPNLYRTILDSTSTVEFRITEGGGASEGSLVITPEVFTLSNTGNFVLCTGDEINVVPTPSLLFINTGNLNFTWSTGGSSIPLTISSAVNNLTGSISSPNNVCVLTTPALNVVSNPRPIITMSDTLPLCQGIPKTLTSSIGVGNVWSTGDTTSSISTSIPGVYTVTVNNCSSSATVRPSIPARITSNGPDTICPGYQVDLTASVGAVDTIYLSYSNLLDFYVDCINEVIYDYGFYNSGFGWIDNSGVVPKSIRMDFPVALDCGSGYTHTTVLNGQPGPSFAQTVTSCNSCSYPASAVYESIMLPVSAYNVNGFNDFRFIPGPGFGLHNQHPAFIGSFARLIIDRSVTAPAFQWSTGDTTATITAGIAGTYTVSITDSNACVHTISKTIGVQQLAPPLISRSFTGPLCPPGNLTSGQAATYLWSTGSTTQAIQISSPGIYAVTIADVLGCTATNSDTVTSGAPGDPSVFGNGVWNVYAYNEGGNSFDTTFMPKSYAGFYVDSTFNLDTELRWGGNDSPSDAPGYQGCVVGEEYHAWIARKRGFPCGLYRIDIPTHDDGAVLFVNGQKVFDHNNGCCDSHSAVWRGLLDSTSTVDFRVTEGVGFSVGKLNIVADTLRSAYSGPLAICAGQSTLFFSSPGLSQPGAYQYNWFNGSSNDSLILNSTSTVYHSISTLNGCVAYSDTLQLNASPLPVPAPMLSSGPQLVICDTGAVAITAGTWDAYLWSDSTTAPVLNVNRRGEYSVLVTNSAGCTGRSDTVVVSNRATPSIASVITNNGPVCPGQPVTLQISNSYAPGGQAFGINGGSFLITNQDLPEQNFTIEMWFKTTQAEAGLFSASNTPGWGHDRHIYLSGGELGVRTFPGAGWKSGFRNLNDNKWHHVAYVVQTGVGQKVYVDGALSPLTSATDQSTFTGQSTFLIGFSNDAQWPGSYFNGQIDNVRIWSMPRTQNQIRDNYMSSLPADTTGLIYSNLFNGNATPLVGNTGNILYNGATYPNVNHYTYTFSGTGAPAGSVSLQQTTSPLSSATAYAMVVTVDSNLCPSAPVNHTVNLLPSVGQVLVNDTLFCAGDTAMAYFTLVNNTAPNFTWQVRKLPNLVWTDTGDTSLTINTGVPPTVADTGIYQLRVVSTGTGNCDSISNTVSIEVVLCGSAPQLQVRAFIEGYYLGGGLMTSVLFNNGMSMDPTACDSVTIELRDPLSPATIVHSFNEILHTDGWVMRSLPQGLASQSYYVVIRHRNSIETWSKLPVSIGNSPVIYDFTTP